MDINAWYKKRGTIFVLERAKKLRERYSFRSKKAEDRIKRCMEVLLRYGCFPTFAVPGKVVERNASFFLWLQSTGAELAVHGYNHIDLRACGPEKASRQLEHALKVFRDNNLKAQGFRCPYLSCSDELSSALRPGFFEYSSNKAIQWHNDRLIRSNSRLYRTIKKFYAPVDAEAFLSLPWIKDGLVEIPVIVPDDLQLHDGLGLGLADISCFWLEILHQTYRRGELFNLLFHSELADIFEAPFIHVLQEATPLYPKVWLARLHEVSKWWVEKSNFQVEIEYRNDHFTLNVFCTPRATLLCRGLPTQDLLSSYWDMGYHQLGSDHLTFVTNVVPLIGISPTVPPNIITDLQRMGYILNTSETAAQCGIYLDETSLVKYPKVPDLIAYIESVSAPLIRFWPWPDGFRSAMCITGDLDALSLVDYALRLISR